ncbi:MAG TPA: multicopper oxidase domain-containing protein [Symbiobacteriaceae bacterium]|nr:multicopper oxidase domain-containing protein [Symbiobacteriaceae bacterium]
MKRNRRIIWSLVTAVATLAFLGILASTVSRQWLPRGPAAAPSPTSQQGAAASALPKATVDFGGQPLQPRMEDGVPTYDLTLKKVQWDIGGGNWKDAFTINGMVPGPELRVKEGQFTRFRVKNELGEATSIHWHGMILPAKQDGIAHLTQDPIEHGDTFVYEFKPGPPGTHMYHSHFNGAKQVTNGLYGALIVEPKDPSHPTHPSQYDKDYVLIIGDTGTLGLVMNGKSFPYNLPFKVKEGQRALLRMINLGVGPHPMHLHGHDFRVVAKDGNAIAQPMLWNTTDIAPGETYDMAFAANNPGSWLFHCHILPHAEGPDGMFGLTMLLEYEGYEPDPKSTHRHLQPTEKRLPGTPGKNEH